MRALTLTCVVLLSACDGAILPGTGKNPNPSGPAPIDPITGLPVDPQQPDPVQPEVNPCEGA